MTWYQTPFGLMDTDTDQLSSWGVLDQSQVVPSYQTSTGDVFQFDPGLIGKAGYQAPETRPYSGSQLLQLLDKQQSGQALSVAEQSQMQELQGQLALPTRDWRALIAPGGAYDETQRAQYPAVYDPDYLGLLSQVHAAAQQGDPQAQQLLPALRQAQDQATYNATQKRDPFSPLGDPFLSAMGIFGLGLGGAAAFGAFAPLAAAGAGAAAAAPAAATGGGFLGSLAPTLATIGQIGTYGGLGANVLGALTHQDWLQKLGLGLGVAGGLAGGLAGLSNAWGSGVQNLGQAAKVAQNVGRIGGALGSVTGSDALKQASGYLRLAGNLGSGVGGLLGSAAPVAQTAAQAVSNTGGPMAWDDAYANFLGWGGDETQQPWYDWATQAAADDPAMATFLGWGGNETQQPWYDPASIEGGGGGGLGALLGTLGSAAGGLGKFLGSNASWLGPAASALGSLGTGLLGSQASGNAAAAQAAALNRGIDLQTAQWLQQQANQAPWLQAGQAALPQLQQLAGHGALAPFQPEAPVYGQNYGRPSPTPGWTPQTYGGYTPVDVPSAAGYRYTPGQGPSAAQYRYTPGQIPSAAAYRYTPGAVPTLSGAALLANDPGVQFRQDEARKALEASALARGTGLSGTTLSALQRQAQDLASQEYGNAWQRASQQAQMREGWAQQASQMGWGQAEAEARLREQVNQIASQQGWSQAQAEAAFREQLAQQAGAQNWSQALQETQARAQQQQFGWQSGLQAQQWQQQQQQAWDQANYTRNWQQAQDIYNRDVYTNEQNYARQLAAYNSQLQQQNTDWNRWAALSGIGQTAVGQLGNQGQAASTQLGSLLSQLGAAQGQGQLNQGNAWTNALSNVNTSLQGGLQTAAYQQGLASLLGRLNA